jgi:ribonuclease-3
LEAVLTELESALGYSFANPELLVRALTHRSLANERILDGSESDPAAEGDNERLEFLGDAVLGLMVAEAMFLLHPEWREGELTRVRAQLVSRQHMAEVAATLEVGRHLRLSKGEDRSGLRRKSTVLSNTMEAVIGALFLDGGLEPVRTFVRRHVIGDVVEHLARELRSGAALGNYKSALQEYLQAARAEMPIYRVKSESGPDHRKRFLVEVRLQPSNGEPGKPIARGMGSTKKHAEQDAARRALERLGATAKRNGDAPNDLRPDDQLPLLRGERNAPFVDNRAVQAGDTIESFDATDEDLSLEHEEQAAP